MEETEAKKNQDAAAERKARLRTLHKHGARLTG
jgi:hypothetical protein